MASGDTLVVWTALANNPPSSGYATLDVRNGIPTLDFDAAATESAAFAGVLPRNYAGGGLTATLHWMATTATSGNVVWGTEIERMNTDEDADSFAAQSTVTGAANGTSGIATASATTHASGTAMDGLLAGEPFRLRVQRLGANASDTMAGDAELVAVELRET